MISDILSDAVSELEDRLVFDRDVMGMRHDLAVEKTLIVMRAARVLRDRFSSDGSAAFAEYDKGHDRLRAAIESLDLREVYAAYRAIEGDEAETTSEAAAAIEGDTA